LVLALIANVVAATSLGNAMVINDNDRSDVAIYYLSPRVQTRSRMTPYRLKRDTFRIENRNLPMSHIMKVYDAIHSKERTITKGNAWRYAFRLCISVRGDDVFFSSDAKAAYTDGGSFALSASEELDARTLYDELDSLVSNRGPGQSGDGKP
jgi:hypothetical protein